MSNSIFYQANYRGTISSLISSKTDENQSDLEGKSDLSDTSSELEGMDENKSLVGDLFSPHKQI